MALPLMSSLFHTHSSCARGKKGRTTLSVAGETANLGQLEELEHGEDNISQEPSQSKVKSESSSNMLTSQQVIMGCEGQQLEPTRS